MYDERTDEWKAEKVNSNVSITNGELMAIKEGIEWGLIRKYTKVVILTDSCSSCSILQNVKNIHKNYIASEIMLLLSKTEAKNYKIRWIPSHSKITGNELADRFAVSATEGCQTIFNCITLSDSELLAKTES